MKTICFWCEQVKETLRVQPHFPSMGASSPVQVCAPCVRQLRSEGYDLSELPDEQRAPASPEPHYLAIPPVAMRPAFTYNVCFSTTIPAPQTIEWLHDIAAYQFDAYTIFQGSGSWCGTPEPSYTFTVTQAEDDTAIKDFAEEVKHTFCQDAVLIIKTPVTMLLV